MRIAVFGTVGAGKSSVSEELSKKLGHEIFPEPVEENPYFEDYYKDLKATVFKMQIYMLAARSKQLKQAQQLKNIIFDRTILEDPIFMKVNHQLGNINDTDFQTYQDFYENVVLENLKIPDERVKFDIVIYLKVSTDKAMERIINRGRREKLNVDRGYWELLNKNYEIFYEKNAYDFPFFVVDAENDNLEEKMEFILKEIYRRQPDLKK
ncbi:deoxyadenosine/deoxycytidine kinase [Williamsoniiplasma somnilux]|uniref:Deoxyadenosine/deoxycytidine kinase n=1 Tax=Williamsoniiplasma somnilux TaxID=215578 RepID=A0A2K8NYF8_9MOLU|nr:deoxynucleoside kinase [Williamsoniiplasma somnilux]ATZ18850.1 deoxyadenosine/deoxycytidine kinase [Williamsoniiplasma somnilux]